MMPFRRMVFLPVNVHVISLIHNANRVSIHRKSSAIDGFKSKDLLAEDFICCFLLVCVCVCVLSFSHKYLSFYLLPCRLKLDWPFVFHQLIRIQFQCSNAKGLHAVCTKCTSV